MESNCDKCGIAFVYPQEEGTTCDSCESESNAEQKSESKEYWKDYQEFLVNLA
jgi:uncharacterized OB-fold protein